MSVESCGGIAGEELLTEGAEGCSLRRGAGIGWIEVAVQAADVADADAMGIVTDAVGTDFLFRSPFLDGAIQADDVVVATAFPAVGSVQAVYLFHAPVACRRRRRAVEDDFGDNTHEVNGKCKVLNGKWKIIRLPRERVSG